MKRFVGLGVFSIVLLLTVATVFSPIALASAGVFNEPRNDPVDVEEGMEADRPLGTLMGGEPPMPLITPPDIMFCDALPNPEQVGNPVNITCMVMDDLGVVNVWVEVTDPDGLVVGNFSMTFDGLMGLWYYERAYFKAGIYTYTVTAEDQEGQFDWDDGMGGFSFLMQDSIPPTITNSGQRGLGRGLGSGHGLARQLLDEPRFRHWEMVLRTGLPGCGHAFLHHYGI
jgi:hypothetical protein